MDNPIEGFQPNREELAWAAGFFDGEGYAAALDCQSNGPHRKRTLKVQLRVNQVNREVLDRFHRAVGVGRVTGPYVTKNRPTHRPMFNFTASSFEDVQAAIAMLWIFLSPVKRDQVAAVLRAHHVRHSGLLT